MNDKKFLQWIYNRLAYHYNENKNYDYMHRLAKIIDNTDPVKENLHLQNVVKRYYPIWILISFMAGMGVAALIMSTV